MRNKLPEFAIKQRLKILFQPIFNLANRQVIGFEALPEPSKIPDEFDSELASSVFSLNDLVHSAPAKARQLGQLFTLEQYYQRMAITAFVEQQLPGLLFLNVHSQLLTTCHEALHLTTNLATQVGLGQDRIIINVSDYHSQKHPVVLRQTISHYHQQKLKVAIDDLGTSGEGLSEWSRSKPEMIRLGRQFIAGCQTDMVKRELLRTFIELGKTTNIKVIAKDIHSSDEYELLCELGLIYAQGNFLATAKTQPEPVYPNIQHYHKETFCSEDEGGMVKQLVTDSMTCQLKTKAGLIHKLFSTNPKLQCLPVVEDRQVVGLVVRHQLMEQFAGAYGHALFDGQSIDQFMTKKPIVVDQHTTLNQASLAITQSADEQYSQHFIVTQQGQYLGLASSRELLRRITQTKIENARYANPLTLLPGNVPIDREIDLMLAKQQKFHLAYIDIDNFKPFNDIYGYAQGDLIIKLLASVIRQHCHNKPIFVGHIGGDDFIIMFKNGQSQAICQAIIDDFKQQSAVFFTPEHRQQQGYYATSRSGQTQFFSLVSLSIGIVSPDPKRCSSHLDIASMASEAKKEAKKLSGNCIFNCRRSHHLADMAHEPNPSPEITPAPQTESHHIAPQPARHKAPHEVMHDDGHYSDRTFHPSTRPTSPENIGPYHLIEIASQDLSKPHTSHKGAVSVN